MISLEKYDTNTEKKYFSNVQSVVSDKAQKNIINGCKKFFPPDFFTKNQPEEQFKELILAPYEKIKNAFEWIKNNPDNMRKECFTKKTKKIRTKYQVLYNAYGKVTQKILDDEKLNVWLVRKTGLNVCPYCNRDYINSRSKRIVGAELDHFYPRSKFPFFSVSLYNLVPVCAKCNHIKSHDVKEFVSPFEEDYDWDKNLSFSYVPLKSGKIHIEINAKGRAKNNMDEFMIEEAYKIHEKEVKELLDKVETYNKTQTIEFMDVLKSKKMSQEEVKKMVFGEKITPEQMKSKPLGRMLRDLERELKVYD